MSATSSASANRYRLFVGGVALVAATGVVVLQMVVKQGSGAADFTGVLPVGEVVYEHDFSTPDNGLLGGKPTDEGSQDRGSRVSTYTPEGTMVVEVTSSFAEFAGGGNTETVTAGDEKLGALKDLSVEVNATPLDVGPGAAWGLACRRDLEVGRFYFASVSLVGDRARASIVRQDEPGVGWVDIASDKIPADVTIEQGATNRLRLDCVANTITLYVDGVEVTSGKDARYPRGTLAVFVRPIPAEGSESSARVEFDDFVVREVR